MYFSLSLFETNFELLFKFFHCRLTKQHVVKQSKYFILKLGIFCRAFHLISFIYCFLYFLLFSALSELFQKYSLMVALSIDVYLLLFYVYGSRCTWTLRYHNGTGVIYCHQFYYLLYDNIVCYYGDKIAF